LQLLIVGALSCGDGDSHPTDDAAVAPRVDATVDVGPPSDAALDGTDASFQTDAISDAVSDAIEDAHGDAGSDGDAACTTVAEYAIAASPHVTECSNVTYATNPPTSGPHYPRWAAYRTYTTPVPRGFYVHDLEHGAVVILYNCPSGCAQELSDIQTYLNSRTADPLCTASVKHRIVVAPDPAIPTKFAAAAWGFALTGDCLDIAALGAFVDAHYAHGDEDVCADGIDVTAADAGVAPDCGK
jgi:hypothetical protein